MWNWLECNQPQFAYLTITVIIHSEVIYTFQFSNMEIALSTVFFRSLWPPPSLFPRCVWVKPSYLIISTSFTSCHTHVCRLLCSASRKHRGIILVVLVYRSWYISFCIPELIIYQPDPQAQQDSRKHQFNWLRNVIKCTLLSQLSTLKPVFSATLLSFAWGSGWY